MDSGPEAIFHPDGDALVPTSYATGPWYAGSQHGGPMLGALARALERLPSERPMQVVRMSADLMRAAPMGPVQAHATCTRAGKSVEFLEATLVGDGQLCARATAMRIRVATLPAAPSLGQLASAPPPPPAGPTFEQDGYDQFYKACEFRAVRDVERLLLWMGLRVPLVAGEPTSPFCQLAALSDFTYTLPFFLARSGSPAASDAPPPVLPINPDTSLNLHRTPEPGLICMDSRVHYDPAGAGTALALLFDARGPIGHSSQSLLVRELEHRPASWDTRV